MSERHAAPIGIVGAGPVGMMLGLFLARYGVRSVLFNLDETSRMQPKGSTQNARTMEHYRRLGFSSAVRRVGLPMDHPTDVVYFTRLNGWELARLRMPSENEKLARVRSAPRFDQEPEPLHRANQMYVEALLYERVCQEPMIEKRFGWRAVAVDQDDEGVTLGAEHIAGGAREDWRVRYLAGCDGGQSFVRRTLSIHYGGFRNLEQAFMGGPMIATYLRMPTVLDVVGRARRAWMYNAINAQGRIVFVSLNGEDEFLLFTRAPEPGTAPDDEAIRRHVQGAAGVAIPVEVMGHNPWTAGVARVAHSFGAGRIVLAGDSVHLFTPTGGFGMNTGIDDAANLSWKLSALVQGWGGPNLLATYETERQPIATRNTTAARTLAINVGEMPVADAVEERSPAGEAARAELSRYLGTLGEEFASLGVQLGARYDGSPIIVADGTPPPEDPVTYRPSSVPGGRAPHFWLGTGREIGDSLYDRLGAGFTLLCLGAAADGALSFAAAASRRGVPFDVMHLADGEARAFYERDYVLVRPDQHIAWRGNAPPADADALLARVTGY
ncbi:MAG TPA: FAD-dependent monooxygenase [Stellaceae bacterium]|nr:FAD-dependent monooxygenase [Stellaceae bacterium]